MRTDPQRRWTIYVGPNGSACMKGFAGTMRCPKNYEEVEVVPADDQHRIAQLAEWIERDRRESDKVLAYAQELRRLAGREG